VSVSTVGGVTHPGVRASDEDRRRVVADLERHTADGRLSLDEFTDRAGRAYRAATHGDLSELTSDLPALLPLAPVRLPGRDQRHLIIALALSLLTIAVLGAVLALLKP
jgi:hypothetical protein